MIALRLPRWTDAETGFWLNHLGWILPPHNLSSGSADCRNIAITSKSLSVATGPGDIVYDNHSG